MILESNDNFDQLAELEPGAESVQFLSRKQHPELTASIVGNFSMVSGTIVSLYRIRGVLHFRIGDQEFALTDDINSTLVPDGKHRVFRLKQGEKTLVNLRYMTPEPEIPLSIDPTPFVEEEHSDFLLFVHNVLTEAGRRYRVWNQ
jgi:hypothetical protein